MVLRENSKVPQNKKRNLNKLCIQTEPEYFQFRKKKIRLKFLKFRKKIHLNLLNIDWMTFFCLIYLYNRHALELPKPVRIVGFGRWFYHMENNVMLTWQLRNNK